MLYIIGLLCSSRITLPDSAAIGGLSTVMMDDTIIFFRTQKCMMTERFSCIHFYHVFIFIINDMIILNITQETIDGLLVSRAFQSSSTQVLHHVAEPALTINNKFQKYIRRKLLTFEVLESQLLSWQSVQHRCCGSLLFSYDVRESVKYTWRVLTHFVYYT